jgi:hypothetical protein
MPTTSAIEVRPAPDIFPNPLPSAYAFLTSSPWNRRINFRHPAYEPDDDLLFSLYAWDHPDGGLHLGLAHTACAIVGANRYDGYLSESRQSTGTSISSPSGDILRGTDYYFHVPNPSGAF